MKLKDIVSLLANRINQPHVIEVYLRKVYAKGFEEGTKQSPWISIDEDLPPVGLDVIHTDINTRKRYYGQVNKVGTLVLGWTPHGEVTATHYMLIPPLTFDEILEANKDDTGTYQRKRRLTKK